MDKAKEEFVKQTMNHIEALHEELENVKDNKFKLIELQKELKEFSKVGKGEILAPITDGLFVQADVKNPKQFFVNVGEGVVVEKDIDEANALMEEQIKKTNQVIEKKTKELSRLYKKVQDDTLFGEK